VGLSATKVRLQFNDWIATLLTEAPHRVDKELLEAICEEGASKELNRIPIFVGTLISPHLVQVSSEFGLLVTA
jgi:hypothetical protein